jgi:hypothetical protein
MSKIALLFALAAVATPSAMSAGQVVGASGEATGAASTTTFVSREYGYSLAVPGARARWIFQPAQVRWTAGSLLPADPQFDTLTDFQTGRYFIVGARDLPAHSTLAEWTRYFLSSRALACTRTSPISRSTLAGVAARSYTFTCSDAYGIGIDAVHGRRGYFMVVSGHSSQGAGRVDSAHRRAFDDARRSFRLVRH